MTRPENAEQTEAQVASKDPEVRAEQTAPARPPGGSDAAPAKSSAAPQQRQRTTNGDGDPQTVQLQVGASEYSREQADRRPTESRSHSYSAAPGAAGMGNPTRRSPSGASGSSGSTGSDPTSAHSPTTVRVGGYTPPERVAPGSSQNSRVPTSGRVPRRTNLQLQRLEPWSVLKVSLVLSVAGFLVWMVAVGVLYGVLAGMGVWDQINGTYSDLTSANNTQVGTALISGGRVFGTAFVIGLVNIVLMTALATVGSLVYNVAADLVGGVEVTLSEPD